MFWAGLFTHRGAVYLLGTEKRFGRIVIRRSTDGGRTWTEPTDGATGLLTARGEYHAAPMPMIVHRGRLWRAIEDAGHGKRWPTRFRAMIISAPVESDLLQRESWTFSNALASDPDWLDGQFDGWLEGNAVVAPDGGVVNLLRVEAGRAGSFAAIVEASEDGKTIAFDPEQGLFSFPGGATKFTVRWDPVSQHYWSLVNWVPPKHDDGRPHLRIRNTLALARSKDLRDWELRTIVLYHPDVEKHGFQYVDWLIEGDDLIAVSRTAYDDGLGGAHTHHDSNFMTFHRLKDFRTQSMADAATDFKALQRLAR